MKYMNLKQNTGRDNARAASNERTPVRLRPNILDAFFNGKMCKRIFSLLLVLSLLFNIPAVAIDETWAADSGKNDLNIEVEADSDESEVGETDEYELDLDMGTDGFETNHENNTFTFNMGLAQNVLLSTILSVNQLPLNMDQIIEVMVLGTPIADETNFMDVGAECLQIERIENDYMITVLRKFLEAGFTVCTVDNQTYTFKLTQVYDPYIAERIEADLSGYSERARIDLPAESPAEDLPIEGTPDDMGADANEVQPVDYSFDLDGASTALLSGILVAADIPLQINDVDMVGLPGGYAEEAGRVISVTEAENDYVIDVKEDFRETGIAVYTAEKQYTIALKNGRARMEAPTEEDIEEIGAEPSETPAGEPTPEPAQTPVEELTPEPVGMSTEEPTPEPTEMPIEESTSEPAETPTEETTSEPIETPAEELTLEAAEAFTEEPTSEPAEVLAAEPAEEPTSESAVEVRYPAQTFTARAARISVTAEAQEGAFPAGTRMAALPVINRDTLDNVADTVADDFVEVMDVLAVDITFYDADGNEIEPLLPVNVVMSVAGIDDGEMATVVHVDDGGAAEIVDQVETTAGNRLAVNVELPTSMEQTEAENDIGLAFEADGFSTYAIVVTRAIETRYIDAHGATYAIEVGYGENAGIYGNVDLGVSELTGGAAEDYFDRAAETLKVSNEKLTYAKALDISILSDDQAVQPLAPVRVSVRLLDAPEAMDTENIKVLHFGEEVETVACALNGNAVEFDAEGFSVYMVLTTVKEQTLTASDGNEYLVTVTYDHESGIPSDAELSVSEIKEGEAGYEEYVAQCAAALGKTVENLAFARPFDITLKNPETGVEYQPNEAVQVSIQLLKDDLNSYASVDVIHIPDGAGEETQVMDTTVHGEAVEFETDGFSVYVLCAFTVDFHWGEYTYSIAGEDSIALSALFAELGITEVTLADVKDVSFSSPELVAVEKLEDDWRLTSLAPFTTEEALVLTLKNGQSVEILVTDADVVASGTCGDNTQWTLDDAGTLTISLVDSSIGAGTVTSRPWEASYKADITEITMDDGITSLPNDAFKALANVKTIRFSPSLTTLPKNVCTGLKALETANFSELTALESIGDDGFNGCTALSSPVDLSSAPNFSKLGACAFKNCSSIPKVDFSGTQFNFQATWNQQMFTNCTQLTEVVLPGTVTRIYANAFQNCTNLETVNFQDLTALETIGEYAFAGCAELTGNGFGQLSALQTIGRAAFEGCTAFDAAIDASGLSSLQSIGAYAFNKTAITRVDLSGLSITEIPVSAFANCKSMTEAILPTALTSISASAFKNCDHLGNVNFSELSGLTAIGDEAFRGCKAIGGTLDLTVASGLTTIGKLAFADLALEKADLSGLTSLTSIGTEAFIANSTLTELNLSGCGSLTSVPANILTRCYHVGILDLSGTAIETFYPDWFDCNGLRVLNLSNCDRLTSVDLSKLNNRQNLNVNPPVIVYLPAGLTSVTLPANLKTIDTIYFQGTEAQAEALGLPSDRTVCIRTLTIRAKSVEKEYDGKPLTLDNDDYTLEPENQQLPEGYTLSVTVTGSQRDAGTSASVISAAKVLDADGVEMANYAFTFVPGKLTVLPRQVTVSAAGMVKTYGEDDPEPVITGIVEDEDDSLITYTLNRTEGEDVKDGPYDVTLTGEAEQGNYIVGYVSGTLTINPAPVTLTAVSGYEVYDGTEKRIEGFTASVEGLTFEGVTASASYTEKGRYDVTFSGVEPGVNTDTTGNYVVTKTEIGTFTITTLLDKTIDGVDGNQVTYKLTVNPDHLTLNGGNSLTLTDRLYDSKTDIDRGVTNQSIDYGTVTIEPAGAGVSYDFSGYTGAYTIPDATAVTITYKARVLGQAGAECTFGNTAALDADGTPLQSDSAEKTQKIYPKASDVDGEGNYMLKLYVYGNTSMQTGLAGAKYALLDANQRPVKRADNTPVTFETDSRGYADIEIDPAADGLALEKNTVYYLEMIKTPRGYQKDNTPYSFVITDDPSYNAGGIYTYFNGDTMKVRLYPANAGLSVTLRFSGNYAMTQDQQDSVTAVLQKLDEDMTSQTFNEWVELERHAASEAQWGNLTFERTIATGQTYRVVQENQQPWDLPNTIRLTSTYNLAIDDGESQAADEPQAFTLTEGQNSVSVVIDNRYEEPRLTITKMDKQTGAKLQGAVFTVRAAKDNADVKEYTTDQDGMLVIMGSDEGYQTETLYYALETTAPEGYLLPLQEKRIYFYFCNDPYLIPEVLADLPEGETAVNLTESYDSLSLDNQKEKRTISVMATWQGNDWPQDVQYVTVGLYQSVAGREPEPVLDDTSVEPLTINLSAIVPYDTFPPQPARDDENHEITYSIFETSIKHVGDESELLDSYVREYGISDSGIFLVHNKLATTLTVSNQWYDQNGENEVTDAEILATQPAVTFDVFRSKQPIEHTGDVSSADMTAAVAGMEKVRENLTLTGNISMAVDALDRYYYENNQLKDYCYYVLETVPSFGEEAYAVNEEGHTVNIKNRIVPQRVNLTVTKAALIDDPRPESLERDFEFTLHLQKDETHPIRSWQVYTDGQNPENNLTTDRNGDVTFTLKPTNPDQQPTDGASIKLSLPQGVTATVTEAYNPEYTVKTSSTVEDGIPSDNGRTYAYTTGAVAATLTYTNTLHVICKVVKDDGTEEPFESLKSALTFIRENQGSFTAPWTIYLLEDYTIPATDMVQVNAGESLSITTAPTGEAGKRFPFQPPEDEQDRTFAAITRGEAGDSMFKNAGALTLENICLDGDSIKAVNNGEPVNGGLVYSVNPEPTGESAEPCTPATLNLNAGAILRASTTDGRGGAVYAEGTVNIADTVAITGNHADSASAIWLKGTLNMVGGSITGNTGASDGAVVVESAVDRIYLSGSPVIFDNANDQGKAANLVIGVDSDNVVNVASPGLTGTAHIGISAMDGHMLIGEQFASAAVDQTANLNRFTNDIYGYRGKLKDGTSTNIVWDGLTLTIQKAVEPVGANPNDRFTVALSSPSIIMSSYIIDGTLDYTVQAARPNQPGRIVFRNVKAGDTYTISPLPVGDYTITEAESNYTPTYMWKASEDEAASIEGSTFEALDDCTVTVTNTRRLAAVKLTKTLSDRLKSADETQDFNFTVKLTEVDGRPVSGFALADGITTGNNGAASLTLSPQNNTEGGVSRRFHAPVGATMTITETNDPSYGIKASAVTMPSGGEGASIEDQDAASDNVFAFSVTDDGADVTFANERKMAEIELSKALVGKVSQTENYTFTVTLTRADGHPAAGYTMYEDADDPQKSITTGDAGTDEAGKVTIPFSFGANESQKSVTLTIPEGTKLEVEETNVNGHADWYNTTYSLNGAAATSGRKVTIYSVSDIDNSIAFTNTRKTQTVTVTNTVSGYSGNVQEFSYTVTVTDGVEWNEDRDDYDVNGFTDGKQTFELATGQNKTLTVPYGSQLTVAESFIVGYKTTIKHGDTNVEFSTERDPEDKFNVTENVTVAFSHDQLIGLRLVNNTSSVLSNVNVVVGYGTEIYRVNEDQTGQIKINAGSNKNVTLSIDPGKTAILEITHQTSPTAEQTYTVSGNMPTAGYYYTINNEPSFHEFADPAILRVYDQAQYTVKGKLRYSITDSIVTFTEQPLVSFNLNGGAWTKEMEDYHWDNTNEVYQMAVTKDNAVAKPDPDPVYPTAEGFAFLGWTGNKEYAEADHSSDTVISFDEAYNFGTAVTAPLTLYAVWAKPARDARVVTVKNGFNNALTVTATLTQNNVAIAGHVMAENLTTDASGQVDFTLSAGESVNLTVPEGAKLVLNVGTRALGVSDQFVDSDTSNSSFTIDSVTRDGTVTFTPGVCKITDDAGNILYDADGQPAVYATLAAAFTAYNGTLYTTAEHNAPATPAAVKMLVDEYAISSKHAFPTKDVILTTAGKDDAEFPYMGTRDRAVLIRAAGYINDTLFTHQASATSVTLENIILDGGSVKINKGVNGGMIYMKYTGAVLNINEGSTLRNVQYNDYSDGNNSRGGAIYIQGGTLNVNAGLFSNFHARRGGAIAVSDSAILNINGSNGSTRFEHIRSDGDDGGAIAYSSTQDFTINGGTDKKNPGIIFTDCWALGENSDGGAIYADKEIDVSVSGCAFTECSARNTKGGNAEGFGGGAIGARGIKKVAVSYCTFNACDTLKCGGAIMVRLKTKYGEDGKKALSISNCEFDNCACKGQGGAVAAYQDNNGASTSTTEIYIENTTFENCSSGTDNGSGGAIQCYLPCMEFEDTNFTDCWAGKEGGAVNNYFGAARNTMWTGSYTIVNNCRFVRCRAEDRYDLTGVVHYGGGMNVKTMIIEVKDSYFEDCVSTLRDGGALHSSGIGSGSKATVTGTTFKNCSAKENGGAFLATNETLTIDNSKFYGCSSFTKNGGAVYHGNSVSGNSMNQLTTTITNSVFSADPGDDSSEACSAVIDGGAIWTRAKEVTIENCTIDGSTADRNGGAICLSKNGSQSATITDSEIKNSRAVKGSAVYVDDTATFSGVSITGNTCSDINSGAIQGGKLYFEGNTVVKGNPCSSDEKYMHDVLMQNNNETTLYATENGLGGNADIGVYVPDNQFNNRGTEGKAFGTWAKENDLLESFFNDRDDGLFGYQASSTDKKIYWGRYLCKITDADGNTLKRANGRDAVYAKLTTALEEFTVVKDEYGETGKAKYIKMLVENYNIQQEAQISNFPGADITLTTAGENDANHRYRGTPGTVCTISRDKRYNSANQLFYMNNADATLQLENITLDGRKDKTTEQGNYRLIEAAAGKVIVNGGTTFQYGFTGGSGGAINIGANAALEIHTSADGGVLFDHCVQQNDKDTGGGAIYSVKSVLIDSKENEGGKTTFVDCNAKRGGAIMVNATSATVNLSVEGAVFKNCHSVSEGGAIYHNNNNNTTASTSIKEVEFENCYTVGSEQWSYGGAVNAKTAYLTVDTCSFKNCYSRSNGGAVNHGSNETNRVKTIITNTTFDGCFTQGTHMSYGLGGSASVSSRNVEITGCKFKNSMSYNRGGALYCHSKDKNSEVVISGTSFENCSSTRTNNNEGYGGAIYCAGDNEISITLQNDADNGNKPCEIKNCSAVNRGGAIYLEKDNSTLNITGNTLISSCYANQGGAIYLKSKVTMNITGSPEFTKNGYTTTGQNATAGACIYLAEGSRINLSGSPKFSRNILPNVDRITNGGIYDNVRQDIYMAGYQSNTAYDKNAASIHVTGALEGDTIWVWPEQSPHRLPNEQFAKIDTSANSLSYDVLSDTLSHFRNALADSVTGCSNGEYLAGVKVGNDGQNVYWDKMYTISFRKIDNKGVAVPGARFTLYKDSACTDAVATAVSANGESDTDAQGKLLAKGAVEFTSIRIGAYYMKETKVPTSFKDNDTVYLVLVGTPYLSKSEANKDLWEGNGPLNVENAETLVARHTTGAGRYFGIFPLNDNGKAILRANLASNSVGIENVRNDYQVAFMKVDSSGAALPGAAFTIYAAILDDEGQPETFEDGYPMLKRWSRDGETYPAAVYSADGTSAFRDVNNRTLPKGVVYFRELPMGTYYLLETATPERNGAGRRTYYAESERVFKLDIMEDETATGGIRVTLSEWQPTEADKANYVELDKSNDDYLVSNQEVVCKLTDASGNLLYTTGHAVWEQDDDVTAPGTARLLPAVYSTLKAGFAAAQSDNFVNASGNAVNLSALKLKVLKDCTLTEPVVYGSDREITFTTAETRAQKDRYIFSTTRTSDAARAQISRGNNGDALITVADGASLKLQNINLNGQKTAYTGRAIDVADGSLTIGTQTLIQNFGADSGEGGAVFMAQGTALTVDGGTANRSAVFQNNAANAGGAISFADDCTVDIKNAQFIGNRADDGNGGAISLGKAPTAQPLTNVVFRNNTASQDGGALRAESCTLTLNNCTFSGNVATNGGAMYASEGANLTLQAGTLSGNKATNGGAMYAAASAMLTVEGGTLYGNSASGNGGAVYVDAKEETENNAAQVGTLTLRGGALSGNNATENGGAVYAAVGASVGMSGGNVTGNNARSGAAMYLADGAVLNMSGGSVTGNTASDVGGGAINVGGDKARLNFFGSPVVYDNPNGNASTQQKNVVLSLDTNDVINILDGGMLEGAKIGVYTTQTSTGDGKTVRDSHGLAGMPFGSFPAGQVQNLNVFINDVADAFGHPFGTTGAEEGTLYWRDYIARVVEANGKETFFEYLCGTTEQGLNKQGAFDFANGRSGNVVIETLLETHNRYTLPSAVTFGKERAVTLRTTQEKKYNPDGFVTTITRGAEYDANSMFTVGAGSLTIDHITLDGDKNNCTNVSANGGIVSVTSGSLTLGDGATLQNSVTTGCGGAVYVAAHMPLTMTGGAIKGNTARAGGGIYLDGLPKDDPELNDRNRDNRAATTTIKGTSAAQVVISGNTATSFAGGIYFGEGLVAELNNAKLTDNQVTGTTDDWTGTHLVGYGSNGTDLAVGSGGAIFVDRKTTLRMNVCTIGEEGHANTASRMGGGIFLFATPNWADWAAASVYITGQTSIAYNESVNGGGIGTVQNGLVSIEGGQTTIAHNTATASGGGVFLRDNGARLFMTGGEISDNQAANQGGGIYDNDSNEAKVVLDAVTVTGNTANQGGGIYANTITLANTQITGNRTTSADSEGPLIDGAGGMYLTRKLVINDASGKTSTNISGNTTSVGRQVPSDLRLPYDKDTKTNNAESVILKSNFSGKLYVVNPGKVNTDFGKAASDSDSAYRDYDDVMDWEKANIVSQDGSELYGRRRGDVLYWYQECICKITDSARNPLFMKEVFTDEEGRQQELWIEAIYMYLFDGQNNGDKGTSESAVGTLNLGTKLYREHNGSYTECTDATLHVEMLVDYGINTPVRVNLDDSRKIILTTAIPKGDPELKGTHGYRGTGRTATLSPGPRMGTLNRNGQEAFMFRLQNRAQFELQNITLDGGVDYIVDGSGAVRFDANGVPLYQSDSFISRKDGFLIQLTNSSTLWVGDGATLQNVFTTHMYGGAAICFGQNTGDHVRKMYMLPGSRFYRCYAAYDPTKARTEEMAGDYGGYGGAISFNRIGSNDTLYIQGGTIEQCWAQEKGGAIYLDNSHSKLVIDVDDGATFTMKDCAAPKGGGIYLDDRGTGGDFNPEIASTLKIEGKVAFSGNYGTDYDGYSAKTNGKDANAYRNNKVRQDIFVMSLTSSKKPKEAEAERITVTGPIDAPAGSIWLWAETRASGGKYINGNDGHYKDAEPFAVLSDGLVTRDASGRKKFNVTLTDAELAECGSNESLKQGKMRDKLMRAFHNALDDDTTKAGGIYPYDTYLTGNEGTNDNWVYWGPISAGFNVVFRKIDGDGEALSGATFTLYRANEDGTDYEEKDTDGNPIPYQVSGEDATATSGQCTKSDPDAGKSADHAVAIKYIGAEADPVLVNPDPRVYGRGLVVFEKIPAGVYFIVENTDEDGTVTIGNEKYKPVEERYRLIVDKSGWYTVQVAPRNANGQPVWDELRTDASGNMTWPHAVNAPKVAFTETTANSGMYSDVGTGTNTIGIFTAMNASSLSRKAILKKVDGTDFSPLGDTNTNTAAPTAKQARFTVYYADRQTVVRVRNGNDASGKDTYETLENLLSGVSGAFWIGKLPYGTYYLHETHVPTTPKEYNKLSTNDNWFILTVNEDGVGTERESGSFLNTLSPLASKP